MFIFFFILTSSIDVYFVYSTVQVTHLPLLGLITCQDTGKTASGWKVGFQLWTRNKGSGFRWIWLTSQRWQRSQLRAEVIHHSGWLSTSCLIATMAVILSLTSNNHTTLNGWVCNLKSQTWTVIVHLSLEFYLPLEKRTLGQKQSHCYKAELQRELNKLIVFLGLIENNW